MERDYDPNDLASMVKAVKRHWPNDDPTADYYKWCVDGCVGDGDERPVGMGTECTPDITRYGLCQAIWWQNTPEGFNYWRDLSNDLDAYHVAHARG